MAVQAGHGAGGNWSHLAFVIDKPNKTIKLYFNGEPTALTFVLSLIHI